MLAFLKRHLPHVGLCLTFWGRTMSSESNIGIQVQLFPLHNSTYPEAGYPDRLGPSGTHFLIVTVKHLFMA